MVNNPVSIDFRCITVNKPQLIDRMMDNGTLLIEAEMWYNEQFLYNDLSTRPQPRSLPDGERQLLGQKRRLLDQRGINHGIYDAARNGVEGDGNHAGAEPGGAGGGTTVSNQVAETQERI